MFLNKNKRPFGALPPSSSFGMASTSLANESSMNQSPFGNSAGLTQFSAGTPMFGIPQQSGGNLPLNSSGMTFGTNPQGRFGCGLLPHQRDANGPFGQHPKPSGFNFGPPSTTSLFGQQQLNNPQQSSPFLGVGAGTQTGTCIKFNPPIATDTIQRGGAIHTINTKFHSISCMPEYNVKSEEELRWEDYQSNRKGPQQITPVHGGTEYRSTFTQPTTPGVMNTGFGFSTPSNHHSTFSQPFCSFDTTPTSNAFSSNAATLHFGIPTPVKPFVFPPKTVFPTPTSAPQPFQFGNTTLGQTTSQNMSAGFVNNSFCGLPLPPGTVGQQTAAPQASLLQSFTATPSYPASGQSNFNFSKRQPIPQTPLNFFPKLAQPAPNQAVPTNFGIGTQTNTFVQGTSRPFLGPTNQNVPFAFPGFVGSCQPQPAANVSSTTDLRQSNTHYSAIDQIFDAFPHRDFFEDVPVKNYMRREATRPSVLKAILEEPEPPIFSSCTQSINNLRMPPKSNERNNTKFALLQHEADPFEDNLFRDRYSRKRLTLGKTRPQSKTVFVTKENNGIHNEIGKLSEENLFLSKIEAAPKDRGDFLKEDMKEDGNNNLPNSDQLHQSNDKVDYGNVSSKSDGDVNPQPVSAPQEPADLLGTTKNPCGMKLTRDDYYTVPPFSEIHKYKTVSGGCVVKGFTIGRLGYGNIYYPDPMDISNLDLDELVEFRLHEVRVYSDDAKTPFVGQGLNRPAQVTLENVWPRHPKTKETITKPDDLEQSKFCNQLWLLAKKQGATFLEYRVETGSWVFAVEHF